MLLLLTDKTLEIL